MKLYLNSNILKGTPEELVTYQELLKEKGLTKDSEKLLFHSGHAHQPTEEEVQDTFKGFLGSLMIDKSSIGSTESSTEEDDEADVGEFYTVDVENSALPSGTLLKKVDKDTHKDSTGQEYLCVDAKALDHIDKNLYQLEDRFNFATKVGVRLTDTTDLAQATEGEYFKLTKEYSDLSVGDIVTIVRDDRDSMPQCNDKYGNFYYLELHHLELVEAEDAEENVEEDSMHDEGAFYTVTEEAGDSPLPVGAILQHQQGNLFIDSLGQQAIISRPSFVDRGSTHEFDDSIKQVRFELAKELGIQLTSTTDFAVEASDRTFQLKEGEINLTKGDFVKIVRDDNDRIPLVQSIEDSDKKDFVYLHHLELVEDDEEEEFDAENYSIFSPEAQTPSRDLNVGDRVKVLNSLGGAVGEATVSAVLEGGKVELAGNNEEGSYLSNWSNYISNVEKIEKPASFGAIQAKAYLEDKSIEQVVEEEQSKHKQESDNARVEEEIYDYYEVVDPGLFASSVEKGTVFKVTGNTYTLLNTEGNDRDYINVVTSTGLTQTTPLRDSVIKPIIDNSFIAGRFKFAKEVGINLSVDTDFEEECKGHYFKVTKDEYLSTFNPTDILTVRRDDNTNAIAFQDLNGRAQYTLLKYTKEVARPSK